jgi:N-acetylglutamate synthase-like GNAT family acetyltransferase
MSENRHNLVANEPFPMARIRRAVVADAAEIARLAAQFEHPVLLKDLCVRIAALEELPAQQLLVAEDPGGALLGWIQVERRLSVTAGERAEIVGLTVDAAARRRGIGTLLVNAAQQWACAVHLGEVVVRSNVMRDASHVFYLARGFSRVKTQHIYGKMLLG